MLSITEGIVTHFMLLELVRRVGAIALSFGPCIVKEKGGRMVLVLTVSAGLMRRGVDASQA